MFLKYLSKFVLRLFGWKIDYKIPKYDKCIAMMAPHTSSWDFVIGRLFYYAIEIKPSFLIKKEAFVFPLNFLLPWLGGIPIDRSKSTSLVEKIIQMYNEREQFVLTIAPEGTRKKVTKWKRGFYFISKKAKVPIILGYLDYKNKIAGVYGEYTPTDDTEKDMEIIKSYYKNANAKHPEKFYI